MARFVAAHQKPCNSLDTLLWSYLEKFGVAVVLFVGRAEEPFDTVMGAEEGGAHSMVGAVETEQAW